MIIKKFLLTLLCAVAVNALWCENSYIVVYRAGKASTEKYFLRISPSYGMSGGDSLPVGSAYFYHAHSAGGLSITGRIENYADWPSNTLHLTTIDNDTTYIKATIKKDAFGNPWVKLDVVGRNEAMGEMPAGGHYIYYEDEVEEGGWNAPKKSSALRSGSGFLVSRKGLVITNYHVIEDSKTIIIRNINGDKQLQCSATVLLKDQKNDLIVLKMNDSALTKLDSISYSIKTAQCDLGERLLVFGYPLTNSMGSDVKLTNGIISSVNGYQDDANSYQLSAPVQPGNSGGPVFDEKGNLLGIINAKHLLAENATYAIKSSYLTNLLQTIPEYKDDAPVISQLWKLSVTEQAKILQRLVYIIEVR
jgi:S1-C subfamily serine protease